MARVITRPAFSDPDSELRAEVARCNAQMLPYLDAVLTLLSVDVRPRSDKLTAEAAEPYNVLRRAMQACAGDLERAIQRCGLR